MRSKGCGADSDKGEVKLIPKLILICSVCVSLSVVCMCVFAVMLKVCYICSTWLCSCSPVSFTDPQWIKCGFSVCVCMGGYGVERTRQQTKLSAGNIPPLRCNGIFQISNRGQRE